MGKAIARVNHMKRPPSFGMRAALDAIETHRTCWIGGRIRGYKTSLAVFLARKLSHMYGLRIVSNFPVSNASPPKRNTPLTDSVLIMDEGGLWLQGSDIRRVAAYLGKANAFAIIPSAIPPAASFRMTRIYPIAVMRKLAVPWVFYRWEQDVLGARRPDVGYFGFNPEETLGTYSSSQPSTEAGFLAWLDEKNKALPRSRWSGDYEDASAREVSVVDEITEVTSQATSSFESALEMFTKIKRKR